MAITLKFEIRKADRSDLFALLELVCEKGKIPVVDNALENRFDEILCQTNHYVLVAFVGKRAVACLSLTMIDSITDENPNAVVTGMRVADGFEKTAVEYALIESARCIAGAAVKSTEKSIKTSIAIDIGVP